MGLWVKRFNGRLSNNSIFVMQSSVQVGKHRAYHVSADSWPFQPDVSSLHLVFVSVNYLVEQKRLKGRRECKRLWINIWCFLTGGFLISYEATSCDMSLSSPWFPAGTDSRAVTEVWLSGHEFEWAERSQGNFNRGNITSAWCHICHCPDWL